VTDSPTSLLLHWIEIAVCGIVKLGTYCYPHFLFLMPCQSCLTEEGMMGKPFMQIVETKMFMEICVNLPLERLEMEECSEIRSPVSKRFKY
jgi:hypothetical protein